jgi:hypothetical protein
VDALNLASSDAVPQRREGLYCDHDAGRSQTTPPETPLLLGSSVKSGRAAEDQYRSGGVKQNKGATFEVDIKMQKHILGLTTSAFILACGGIPASAQQQEPLIQLQPQILQQQQELQRQLQGVQTIRPRGAEDDSDQDDNGHGGGRMMGSWHHRDWGRGAMGRGMMDRGGMMGPGSMGRGMMMRMMFSLMDADGDGAVSLQEFQAAHERIFRGMDANKDGRLSLEEIQTFMQGARRSVPRP